MTPDELGCALGISEGEATAFLSMLAREGKVRICQVELNGGGPSSLPSITPSESSPATG